MKHKKKWKSYYDVSFEVTSSKDKLIEISSRIGFTPSSGSCDFGDRKGGKKVKYSWWRWFTNLSKDATLDEHFKLLISKMKKSKAFKKGSLKKEYKVSVSVAKYFNVKEVAAPGFWIKSEYIQWLSKCKVELHLVSYPCEP